MKLWLIYGIVVFLTLNIYPAFSGSEIENDLQQWTTLTLKSPIGDKAFATFLVQPRIGQNISAMSQMIIRPALGVNLNDHISASTGYDWFSLYDPRFQSENRWWQQVAFQHHFSKLKLHHRARLESRFLDGIGETSFRGRYRLRVTHPLKNSRWYAVGSNELFINFNTVPKGPNDGFDQNRIFIGLGRKVGKKARIESGYLMQYFNRNSPAEDFINHIILVQLSTNIF